jgi:TolB-like protein/Tfp pilus assembly protein PilF
MPGRHAYVDGLLGANRPATVSSRAPALRTEPARLSIVVLPFTNLSGDPSQDYFADGITENLTTELSRIRSSYVIGRNTAFIFKGKSMPVSEISKELGVRYVLQGSVQRDQSRVRVNAQLVDAQSGGNLWAERFDKPVDDLFEMEDEIIASLANQLGAELVAIEARRAERTPNPDSTDLYFQGMAWLNKAPSSENLAQARSFFDRAVALDPDNLDALIGTAAVDAGVAASYVTDKAPRAAAAEATLNKVLSLAPKSAAAHLTMGLVLVITNRGAQGITECERALSLDPNLAAAHGLMGLAKIANGRAAEAEGHAREALRLSPRDPAAYIWVAYIAAAKLFLGADEEAVGWYRRSIEINRNYPIAHLYLAAALEGLGRHDEAQAEAQTAHALNPYLTIRRFRDGAYSDNPVFLSQRERLIEAMRKAGVPEG